MRSQFKQATMTPAACSCLSPAAQPGTNPLYLSQPLMCRKHTHTNYQTTFFTSALLIEKQKSKLCKKQENTYLTKIKHRLLGAFCHS